MLQFSRGFLFFLSISVVGSSVQPAPIAVKPSGKFCRRHNSSGNDGSWSTFSIGVGTKPQFLELLPSTQVPESWVVLNEGCTKGDPENCTETRGGVFNYNQSTTWSQKDIYALTAEANLGYTTNSDNGAYGWDNLVLGTNEGANITMNHSVIAGIATKDFYLGILGLAARPIVWEDHSDKDHSDNAPGLISSLKSQELIPTLSYGFTAGASYKNAPGSLTIGGYDETRLTPNDVSFAFGSQSARQLTVAVQGISVTNSNADSQLLPQGMFALVDSTVPHIWLPEAACESFERAFGIVFDPITGLYLVNDTQHDAMVKQNAIVTFQLGTSLSGGSVVNIKLPYASFDLVATGPPLVKSQKRYFPLRRAKDETQYTLGRTFLQEAFIIVDYDNNKFSISQAQYSQGTPSHIVLTSPTDGTNTTSNGTNSDNPTLVKSTSHASHGIGTGAIAGIAVAIVLLVVAAAGLCFWRYKSKRSRRDKAIKGKHELEGDVEPNGGIHEAYGKRRLSNDSTRDTEKVASIKVAQVAQTPPAELAAQSFGESSTAGTSLEQREKAELPSSDPHNRHELSGLEIIRSELSTPEPASELSTADPSLVPEMASRELAHEMPGYRNSQVRPPSKRMDSVDSDSILPQDSASVRPTLQGRKGSEDTLPTPVSPQPQPKRPSILHSQRRHSGHAPQPRDGHGRMERPQHIRLHSSSSHDTFETRFNESHPNPHGSPSPLASPPLGAHPSPPLSALNSPTIPHTRIADNGPLTPGLGISEEEPFLNPQRLPRGAKFSENLTEDRESVATEGRPASDRSTVVKNEVEKLEDQIRRDGR
ncbi:MAG: hypothetical protein Q9181_002887 [Wetmoreana brouardii]